MPIVGGVQLAQKIDIGSRIYTSNNTQISPEELDEDNENMTLAGESSGLYEILIETLKTSF